MLQDPLHRLAIVSAVRRDSLLRARLALPLALSVAPLRGTVALAPLLPLVLGTARLLTRLLARRAAVSTGLGAARLAFTLSTTARGTLLSPGAAIRPAASLAALLL